MNPLGEKLDEALGQKARADKDKAAKSKIAAKRQKKRINSRAKGARGEREFCDWLKARSELFADAHRTAQHCGITGEAADVRAAAFDRLDVSPEVKRVESGTKAVYDWVNQAARDAEAAGKRPVVFHRASNRPWLAILPAEDLIALYAAIADNKRGLRV